mmetsp:Transcript_11502/g.22988  ORF Transcript_11502/g.22988 Transcript_11502/m.22988 type:complete len:86 (+) Transcript_11502:362-619(+)
MLCAMAGWQMFGMKFVGTSIIICTVAVVLFVSFRFHSSNASLFGSMMYALVAVVDPSQVTKKQGHPYSVLGDVKISGYDPWRLPD